MSKFPEIDGIEWMDKSIPDIIGVRVVLVHRLSQELGLSDVPTEPSVVFVDLSRLAGLRYWYPDGCDDPSETECSVDVEGVDNFIATVTLKNMLKAWKFYKQFKYSK